VLDSFVSRFTIRHEELTLALNVRSAITIEEINSECGFLLLKQSMFAEAECFSVKHMKRSAQMRFA
jgi:hypothetical protein